MKVMLFQRSGKTLKFLVSSPKKQFEQPLKQGAHHTPNILFEISSEVNN